MAKWWCYDVEHAEKVCAQLLVRLLCQVSLHFDNVEVLLKIKIEKPAGWGCKRVSDVWSRSRDNVKLGSVLKQGKNTFQNRKYKIVFFIL